MVVVCYFLFNQNTAYELRIRDWSSDVCSSELLDNGRKPDPAIPREGRRPSGCKALLLGKKSCRLIPGRDDGTQRISTGSLRASSRGNTKGASVTRNYWA